MSLGNDPSRVPDRQEPEPEPCRYCPGNTHDPQRVCPDCRHERGNRLVPDGGEEVGRATSQTHVALCSGGHDSVVATHAAMRWGPCEVVMYLDTGGPNARENQDFVREYCREYGWHLIQWQTPEDYEDLVRKYGFPGPSKHDWFYRYLKERQVSKFATLGDELHFWTGVHRAESEKRMQRVIERDEDQSGRWYWHAPLADWQPDDFDRYHAQFGLPENELWSTLGRSGDCWCGAYANRMELIDAEAAGLNDVVGYLRGIEDDLDVEECGFDDPRREDWAWHDDDKSAWAMDDIEDGEQFTLCSSCGPVLTDGGEDSAE